MTQVPNSNGEMKRMRFKSSFVALPLLAVLVMAMPAMAKPTTLTVPMNQAQFQWRAWAQYGDWSYSYLEYSTSTDFELTGKVLHTSWTYSPDVTNLEGASTVYAYNTNADLWIEHEGTVSYEYEPYYGSYVITNYFRGYLEFDGQPSETSFEHGVAYQWVYIYAPEDDAGVTDLLPYAQWDDVMGA